MFLYFWLPTASWGRIWPQILITKKKLFEIWQLSCSTNTNFSPFLTEKKF